MNRDLISILVQSEDKSAVLDVLAQTSFDELIVLDLQNDSFHSIYHVPEKYSLPVLSGALSFLYDYCANHLIHPDEVPIYRGFMDPATLGDRLRSADTPGFMSVRLRFRLDDGNWCWTEQVLISGTQYGLPEGIAQLYIYDIRVQRERLAGRSEEEEEGNAKDPLTGLITDRPFIRQGKEIRPTLEGKWCVLSIDIENFKLFCEWNGQENGEYVLAQYGRILAQTARDTHGLAGYRGQDDFSLLCPYDMNLIHRLYDRLCYAIRSRSTTVGFTPMIGICVLEEGVSFTDALNHSGMIAEEIKGDYRTRIKVFDAQKYEENTRHLRLLGDFQAAMENGDISFYLQPQCRVSTGGIVGAESLARWQAKDGSWISPAYFVPILEKFGIVTNLDQYIWESVCKWLRKILDEGYEPVPISINVSRIDIFTLDVPSMLSRLMEKYVLDHHYLKIEITESAYVDDSGVIKEVVSRLREMGVMVLMDDFGSGYSSLNMLSSLNVDIIKLDAQFLHLDAAHEQKGISILESIINMTKMLGTPIIVEGVETQEQVSFLADLGCRYMQGFYFYEPMPIKSFEQLIYEDLHMDHQGFQFKANQQLHTREFLDTNLFTDAMLNNVLGPVCFFNWHDDTVDIIRFNQQFYLLTGLDADVLEARRHDILQFFVPADIPAFLNMLRDAMNDHLNGGVGTFRVYKYSGAISYLNVRVYFINEDENGKKFYASNQDVTDTQVVNRELPGAYYRCTLGDGFSFLYMSESFLEMTGYTEAQIRTLFDNKLINMVHPNDVQNLVEDANLVLREGSSNLRPYRIRHKNGGYIYVVENSRLTDRFGSLCWQCVAIEVTEVMRLRNQMRLLEDYFRDDIIFIHEEPGQAISYEVVVHGMEKQLGCDKKTFQRMLNDGSFLAAQGLPEWRKNRDLYWEHLDDFSALDYTSIVSLPDREPFRMRSRYSRIRDEVGNVGCVLTLTVVEEHGRVVPEQREVRKQKEKGPATDAPVDSV